MADLFFSSRLQFRKYSFCQIRFCMHSLLNRVICCYVFQINRVLSCLYWKNNLVKFIFTKFFASYKKLPNTEIFFLLFFQMYRLTVRTSKDAVSQHICYVLSEQLQKIISIYANISFSITKTYCLAHTSGRKQQNRTPPVTSVRMLMCLLR